MERLPISVLLLARNESGRLEKLLPALAFAREVVVVIDPSTTDASREVASAAGAKVVEHAFEGFGPQRTFALSECTQPWVFWIDADERPGTVTADEFRRAIAVAGTAGYRLRRATWFFGRRIRHCGWQNERVLRLFRRSAARFDDAPVHEQVHVQGRVDDLDVQLEHHSYETWDDCRTKLVHYARAGAERARRAGRRASGFDVLLRPPLRFFRMYVLQAGILDGAHGIVLCALASAQVFLKYAELWADGWRPPGVR